MKILNLRKYPYLEFGMVGGSKQRGTVTKLADYLIKYKK
jgi:hypothetical protein